MNDRAIQPMGHIDQTVTCCRRLAWDALHRVPGHTGACRAFHGHRYTADVTCAGPVSETGMVIDFGLIKREVGQWVDHHWDHTAILWREDDDPAVAHIIESNRRYGREVYLLTDPPTAEHIACELALIAQRLLASAGIIVVQVTVAETPNGSATWKREADKREVDERRTP